MDFGLQGRVALVAGASRGLGRAIAMQLAREGCIVGICARGGDTLERTTSELSKVTTAWSHQVDMSDPVQINEWVEEAVRDHGRIDIVVHNTGGPPAGAAATISLDVWRDAYESTLRSAIVLAQAAVPVMRSHRWGRIVNVTSISVKQPIEGLALSNSMRMGVVGFAKTLSREIAKDGITVNNVCPGYTDTDRLRQLAAALAKQNGETPEHVVSRWEQGIPAGRIGKPKEIAALVAFLASEPASYITGTTIQVDGGATRGPL